ncbi:MAG: SPFH domain-containing protein [Paludibaculum sp.]
MGEADLDELLSAREKLNARLQSILDGHTASWGIKVSLVEVKQVDLPDQMVRAIARQAEAERERRAKVIHAEGEFMASQRLAEAAKVLQQEPTAIQLRYLRNPGRDRRGTQHHHRLPASGRHFRAHQDRCNGLNPDSRRPAVPDLRRRPRLSDRSGS